MWEEQAPKENACWGSFRLGGRLLISESRKVEAQGSRRQGATIQLS
jgi:hypothetical protein